MFAGLFGNTLCQNNVISKYILTSYLFVCHLFQMGTAGKAYLAGDICCDKNTSKHFYLVFH